MMALVLGAWINWLAEYRKNKELLRPESWVLGLGRRVLGFRVESAGTHFFFRRYLSHLSGRDDIRIYIYINKHDSHICSFETCSLGPRGLVAFSSVETREHKKTRRTPPKTRNPKWLLSLVADSSYLLMMMLGKA